ncbi:hypothetical protein HN51_062456 [Arachis hypogaea]|uniref:uncharacterized protein LOC110265975 n=1 Tax=Arachis ipaensis TaxID=130454 RepID=UPI000A2B750E|nr:uncharacterized protein LOC110265975 [Arachis ipaensis]QHO19927.1 Quinone oxidoreductase [Arachis hypogaea]
MFSKSYSRFCLAGSEEKLAFCKDIRVDVCINYKTEDFVARVKEETGGQGVDIILDCMGASYYQRNLDSLNFDGRLFILGFQEGTSTQTDLRTLVAKRLTVQGVANFGLYRFLVDALLACWKMLKIENSLTHLSHTLLSVFVIMLPL